MKRRRCSRVRIAERLEGRWCLSTIAFVKHSLEFPNRRDITPCLFVSNPWDGLYATELGNDGNVDLLAFSHNDPFGYITIGWFAYEQLGDRINSREVSQATPDEPFDCFDDDTMFFRSAPILEDIDGDGDTDLLAASGTYSNEQLISIGWFDDPLKLSQSPHVVADDVVAWATLRSVDLDNDDDSDLVVASRGGLSWFENLGAGIFGGEQSIVDAAKPQFPKRHLTDSLDGADLDGDGDIDLLLMGYRNDRVVWFPNVDGRGKFGEERLIADLVFHPAPLRTPPGSYALFTADIDGDGDLDVTSRDSLGEIVWHENADGSGQFLATHQIGRLEAHTISLADLDSDGDIDLISASDDSVFWFENSDGAGVFGEAQRIASVVADRAGPLGSIFGSTLSSTDVDSDGDLDIVWANGTMAWLENRLLGDSNDDGTFDLSDLVNAFAAGKFEMGDGATYDEGDWNQDGLFDSSDIVFAFQSGLYVANAEPFAASRAAVDVVLAQHNDVRKPAAFVA